MEDMGDWGMPGNSFIRWAGEKAVWAAEWSNWEPGDTEEAEAGSVGPETRDNERGERDWSYHKRGESYIE